MNEYDLIILFSGGADSVLMLEFCKDMGKKPYCVIIDYEQLHNEEIDVAKEYLDSQSLNYRVVKISNLGINSGLTGSGEKNKSGEVHEMHVASRNLMFVSITASIAEDRNIGTIWYGADWSDFLNKFPDCKQDWLGKVNKVLEINGPKEIKFEAPLLGLSKENILLLLEKKGIDMEDIFSGYGDLY